MSAPTVALALPDDSNAQFDAIVRQETWSAHLVDDLTTLNAGEHVQVFRNTATTDGISQTTYSVNLADSAVIGWTDLDADQALRLADALRAAVLGYRTT